MEPYQHYSAIGRGSFGIVDLYKAADGKFVIIKKISLEYLTEKEEKTTYREAEMMSRLNHPNIIHFYNCFVDDRSLHIVMEYAQGGTLKEYIDKRKGVLIAEMEVVYLFSQLVLGLHHVHKADILHRDLKPSNILLHAVGIHTVFKIADFGLSKMLESKTKLSSILGTPCYLAPELCEGHSYGKGCDIWALGCILCEIMTLEKAFGAQEALGSVVRKILQCQYSRPNAEKYGRHLRSLLDRLLSVDPAQRPTTEMIMADIAVAEMCLKLPLNIGLIACQSTFSNSN
ncbi:serine/threonine-protein kinase Nek8-like isoform X2 [Periplaneta americana]|uniref:serine/threonine-protein kinase Nek8-like isoform X2 n=1 Tax=Periplaneta americana TaxID=6978 RepID=UPI0037E83B52